jgi:hypothetical protein
VQATYRLAIASFVFHVLALTLGWGVVKWTSAQADDLHHAAELSTLQNKMVSTAVKATNTALAWSARWLHVESPRFEGDNYEQTVAMAREHGHRALVMSVLLGAATAGFIAFLYFGVLHAMEDGPRLCARHMCYTALVLFLVGVSTTAISLVAFKEMPIIGKVIFKFEAKGIAETIGRMFSSGNVFLGGLICLLSIVFPLTKLCLTWYGTLPETQYHEMAMKLVKKIEKWSMADVFVVAVILSCFAIDGDKLTDATIGPGVYFFAAYCILTLLAGIVLASVASDHAEESEG